MRFTLFKLPQSKRFEYKPLFYNKEKEEFEERVKRIKAELGINDNANNNDKYITSLAHGSFRKSSKIRRKSQKTSVLRILIIALILLILFYFLLFQL